MKAAFAILTKLTKGSVADPSIDVFALRLQKNRQREDRRNPKTSLFKTRSEHPAV
jgi:hypothetical protein